ncbi:hypothetical protein BC829DRAFT_406306 [Chytridium lagenaria]|nr:hypothetical protein BC829DRAFT_406306 [Chytridium lagenaria]
MAFEDLIEIPRVVELLKPFSECVAGKPLSCLAFFLFKRRVCSLIFKFLPTSFGKFITTIEQGYHSDIPFHNATHACDCFTAYPFSHMDSIAKITNEFDILALFFAAIVHDYDHPGLQQKLPGQHIRIRTILYNDKSVLENHHLASAFTVLNKPDCNFLSHMPKAEFKSLREIIIEMNLSQHFVILSMFKNKVAQVFDPEESREDRVLLWKEFMRQGDMEKRLNIPVSLTWIEIVSTCHQVKSGFIDYVILPLFEAYDKDHWWVSVIIFQHANVIQMYMKTIGVIHMANVVAPPPKTASLHARESSPKIAVLQQ